MEREMTRETSEPLSATVADWRSAALIAGELTASNGPNGYYAMNQTEWLAWFHPQITDLRARLDAAEQKLEAFEEYKAGVEAVVAEHVRVAEQDLRMQVGTGVDMLCAFQALHPAEVTEDTIRAAFGKVLRFAPFGGTR